MAGGKKTLLTSTLRQHSSFTARLFAVCSFSTSRPLVPTLETSGLGLFGPTQRSILVSSRPGQWQSNNRTLRRLLRPFPQKGQLSCLDCVAPACGLDASVARTVINIAVPSRDDATPSWSKSKGGVEHFVRRHPIVWSFLLFSRSIFLSPLCASVSQEPLERYLSAFVPLSTWNEW